MDVSDCATVTDVDVDFVLQHSQVADLVLGIEHNGVSFVLWNSNTASRRGAWLRFDDEAAFPASTVGVDPDPHDPWPVGFAVVTPDNPLSTFDGGPGDGTWTLTVSDDTAADDGELQQFGVDVECEGPPPPGPLDPVIRLFGAGRVQTAVAVSQESFVDPGTAAVAVLATEGNFADALAGTPLAVVANGPLLLTPAGQLAPDTATELDRVVPPQSLVYLLGGQAAHLRCRRVGGPGHGVHHRTAGRPLALRDRGGDRRRGRVAGAAAGRGDRRRQRLPGRAGRRGGRGAPGPRAAAVQRRPAAPGHRRLPATGAAGVHRGQRGQPGLPGSAVAVTPRRRPR